MYLDTDIILALVKETDWLKPYVDLKLVKAPRTSTFTIVEAELVMEREYGRPFVYSVLDTVKSNKIDIIPLTQKVVEKSRDLLKANPNLNIFDSVHAAFAIIENETILSTDNIFKKILPMKCADPRDFFCNDRR